MNYSSSENANGVGAAEHREGSIARSIEQQTAKLPSDVFLWAAGAVIVGSLALELVGIRRERGMRRFFDIGNIGGRAAVRQPLAGFVGLWAPTLLLLGIYNKIVKVAGSDRFERFATTPTTP